MPSLPGRIVTDMLASNLAYNDKTEEWFKQTPLGRFGKPRDVADMIAFLVTTKAWYRHRDRFSPWTAVCSCNDGKAECNRADWLLLLPGEDPKSAKHSPRLSRDIRFAFATSTWMRPGVSQRICVAQAHGVST